MLTIGEFSRISRVAAKTLRYYDQIGLFKPRHIDPGTGYRYYDVSQLREMLLIVKLKQYRFSLPEIAAALLSDCNQLMVRMQDKRCELLREIDEQNHVLQLMGQDIQKLERCENIMQTNYSIKTAEVQPKNIYSVRRRMSVRDFADAIGELFAGLGRSRLKPIGPPIAIYHSEDFNPEDFDCEVGVEVQTASGEHIRKLEPGLCCYAQHIGPYDEIGRCYTALMEWVKGEGFMISGPPFEVYIKGMESSTRPEELVTEVFFPIRK